MIDLPEARALIERAREDTSDGLTARERLVQVAGELCDALEHARSLRLERPADAVDPARHTPERVRVYLAARGWHPVAERETYDLWQFGREPMADAVCMPSRPGASDYRKRLGIALGDLARHYGTGELAVLTGIEAADA